MKIREYNKFLLLISLILFIFILHTSKICQGDYVLKLDSLNQLDQEFIFEYNSTYTYKTFYLKFDGIELTKFNRLTLFFMSSGDKTTLEGLKITFFWNDTIIKFAINKLFQDHQEHNISKSFTFNSNFAGTINATVICEGQSSTGLSGALTILNSTSMEKVTVPTLLKTPTKLPSVPNWLTLQGNFFSSDSDSIGTAIYNTNTNLRTNLSISFTTNGFSAYAQTIEVYTNFERLKILNFQGLEKEKIYCSFQLEEGFNIISIVFTINNSMGIIEISNIELEAYAYSLENSLPDSVYDWFFWEDEIAEYVFDISSFKSESNFSEQIMHVKLDYGYTGIIQLPIYYNLYSGEESICQGEFQRMEQILPIYEEKINTYTTLYFQNLTLKVSFSTEGEGIFFLFNSSSIDVETIPLLDEYNLERVLEEEKVIVLPTDDTISIHYFDVFQVLELVYSRRDFSLNFDVRSETGEPVKQVDVIVSSGIQVLIEESSFNETSFVFLGKIRLMQIYSVIHIKLVLYGDGEEVLLCNLRYVIEGSKSDEPVDKSEITDVGWKPVYLVAIVEILFMLLVFLHVILRKSTKKTTMKKYNKSRHNSLKEQIWNTLDWIIVGKNRILRGFIGLVVVVLNIVNFLAMVQILDFMEQYQKISGLLISNHVLGWVGLISLSASGMFATIMAMHFASFLTLNFAFFEDNLLKTLLLGILTILLFSMGWTITLTIFLTNPYLFENYAPDIPTGVILLVCVISMLILSIKLAKKRAIVYRTTLLEILKKGCVITKGEELRDAIQKGIVHRMELTNIPQNEKRNKLNKIIDEKIFPNDPVSLKRLSVLSSIDIILTEYLLMDILEEEPTKGIYDKENQIFLKLSKDTSIVRQTLNQITEIEGKHLDNSVSEYENHIENYEKLFLDYKLDIEDLITNSNIIEDTQVIQKIQFIINKRDGSFIVNPDLIELIKDLKNGKSIRIKEITKGEQIEQKIDFEQIANETSSIRHLLEQFLYNIEALVIYINEKHREFFKQWIRDGQTFQSLSDKQKTAYFQEFSRFLYVECTVTELFTEDSFNTESGLFTGKNYEYYQKLEPLSDILVKYLSSTMKGEQAIIFVFLHSLLLLKSESHIEFESKFYYVAKQVAEKIQSKAEISHKFGGKNFVITNYYNPFIHIDFSVEQNNQISIEGWKFRKPADITYRDGIWFDKLPFTLNEEKKILSIVRKDWNKLEGFSNKFSSKGLSSIRKEMKVVYQWNDKQIPIEMLYVHNRYYSKYTADEFKEKILKQIFSFPKQSRDWYSYLIYRQEMGYIQGKDMFDTCNFILFETYSDENNNIKSRYVSDSKGNYLRDAIIEIESKSSYFKIAPYAVKYQEFGFTNKIQKKFGGIYVNNEDLKIVIKRFLEGLYDICFAKEGKKKSLRQELGLTNSTFGSWVSNRNYNKALKILRDNKFDILGKKIDRIETKTSVSGQKHLLRRLINAVENNPELSRNYDWYEKLTSKNVSERNKNFVCFIEKILKKYEEYEGLILKDEILELVSNYNSFILYYNILLFSSGYPVLTFNSDFMTYDFYLPQEFNILSKMPTNTSTPTWRGITGGLTKLSNSSLNLRVKVIMPDQKKEKRVITLSKSTFHKPIRIEKNGSFRWVYAMRILDGMNEKVIVVKQDSYVFKKIKRGKIYDILDLNKSEIIYGTATLDKAKSDLSAAYAKEKLTQLLLYGGEQYNGLKIGAIINLFNEKSSDNITGKQVKLPFLHFLLVASNKTTGDKQSISLAYPIIDQQMKKSQSNTKRDNLQFRYRPSILGVAYYTLNQLLGTKLDLSVAFGDSTKFYDETYWVSSKYRNEKMDSVSKVTKGRKKDVAKIVFAFKHVFNNIFGEKRKRGIDRINFSLFVKENRATKKISFSNEKLDKHYFLRKIGIPLISKKAVSTETYTWYQTVAKAPHILLKNINDLETVTKKRESTNTKHRHRASVSFVKMIDEIGKELSEQIHKSTIWKVLIEIHGKYILDNSLQISPEDWATIIITLFPEIITAPKIPYALRKTHLSEFDITKLKFDAPNPNEFVKLFNDDTTRFSCYSPYNTFYNFIGIFLMSTWKISSKNSNKTWINYPFNDWSQPEIIIKPFLRNWLPFLIYRAQSLQNFFLDPAKIFNIFDTKQMLESKFISTEFYEIMNYSFEDIKIGKTLIEGVLVEIPLHERILWMLVRESQYTDTFSFKLKNYREKRESFLEFSEYFNKVGLNEHKIDEFIQHFGNLFDD